VDGEAGVRRVLSLLRTELELALALCGCASLRDVGPHLLLPPQPHPCVTLRVLDSLRDHADDVKQMPSDHARASTRSRL
jgi:hypothetical protein